MIKHEYELKAMYDPNWYITKSRRLCARCINLSGCYFYLIKHEYKLNAMYDPVLSKLTYYQILQFSAHCINLSGCYFYLTKHEYELNAMYDPVLSKLIYYQISTIMCTLHKFEWMLFPFDQTWMGIECNVWSCLIQIDILPNFDNLVDVA